MKPPYLVIGTAIILWMGSFTVWSADLAFNCKDVENTLAELKSESVLWREMRNDIRLLESSMEDRKHSLIDFSAKAIEIAETWKPSVVSNTDYCSMLCANEQMCINSEDCYSKVCLEAQGACPYVDTRTSFENVCRLAEFAFSKFRRAVRFVDTSTKVKDMQAILKGMSAYESSIPILASMGRLLQEEVALFKQLDKRLSEFEQGIQMEESI